MKIKNVIYNPPAVIVYWEDGSRTVSKVDKHDKYNKLTGFLLCLAKHEYGNKNLWKTLEKWVWETPGNGAVVKKKPESKKNCNNSDYNKHNDDLLSYLLAELVYDTLKK